MGKKTIEINPAFLNINSKKNAKQNKSKKLKKTELSNVVKPNKLRKELLNKVKEYQKNINSENQNNKVTKNIESDLQFNSEFNDSMTFLNNLSNTKKNKKKEKKIKRQLTMKNNNYSKNNITIKNINRNNNRINNSNNTNTNTNTNNSINNYKINNKIINRVNNKVNNKVNNRINDNNNNNNNNNNNIITRDNEESFIEINTDDSIVENNNSNECPPWGCIKNGNKPTYREWLEKSNNNIHDNINNRVDDNLDNNLDDNVGNNVNNNVNNDMIMNDIEKEINDNVLNKSQEDSLIKLKNPRIKANKIKRIKTVKFNLGKKDSKIGVLIKDRKTRKHIQHEHGLLKQKSIIEIKKYLRDKNLIKNTSDAPNDVLRELYEQSILSGDIYNKSANTLVHNYLN